MPKHRPVLSDVLAGGEEGWVYLHLVEDNAEGGGGEGGRGGKWQEAENKLSILRRRDARD